MATNYRRGAAVEYAVVKLFKAWGYDARRVAGSHGPYDVVAIGYGDIVLIQCKSFKKRPPNADIAESLWSLSVPPGVKKFLAIWHQGRGWYNWVDANGRVVGFKESATPANNSSGKRQRRKA